MKITKKLLLKIGAAFVAGIALIWVLLSVPQPFFHASVKAKNLSLYSDQPFTLESGQRVLELVEAKLAKSPLYAAEQQHLVFICNARWRQRLFFTYVYGAGGVNYYPFTTNVFLRDSIIEENCLIGPKGGRVPGDRTLDYFIAHEITHTLTGQAVGPIDYHRLPQWKREGYADYVGKGATFNYDEAKRAFLADDPKMDWAKSGLYWRFHLLVAHLLEKQHWSVQQMLEAPIEQAAVEEMIRAEKP
ncbi:MAG: hypothetical protein JNM09_21265 [Blastocatellia bacterium]|nr:hypothetical protein [Blastocatellia bacterium]